MNRSYSELMQIDSFVERVKYLKLGARVGDETFERERYINQQFYRTGRWLSTRDSMIIRDDACDLGLEGHDIFDMIIVHHINPITLDDIMEDNPCLYDPENLVCTRLSTHNSIHYGKIIYNDYLIERSRNDTIPWKK